MHDTHNRIVSLCRYFYLRNLFSSTIRDVINNALYLSIQYDINKMYDFLFYSIIRNNDLPSNHNHLPIVFDTVSDAIITIMNIIFEVYDLHTKRKPCNLIRKRYRHAQRLLSGTA